MVSIGSDITCFEPNGDDSKLLFGCSDGILALYDIEKASVKKETSLIHVHSRLLSNLLGTYSTYQVAPFRFGDCIMYCYCCLFCGCSIETTSFRV